MRGRGIGNFAEARARSERSGAKDSSPWFCLVCRARPCGAKKPFCRLDFLLLVCLKRIKFLWRIGKRNGRNILVKEVCLDIPEKERFPVSYASPSLNST